MNSSAQKIACEQGESERKYRAPALEKGLDILELLARSHSPMTTSQIALSLGRSVSELFRMVLALEYRGYISPSPDGGYSLTNRLFSLGLSQGASKTLLEAALPVMKELSQALGQSCHLVVASGDQIVVVARMESPQDVGFSVRVGYRRQLVETNAGALLFGCTAAEVQDRWLPQLVHGMAAEQIDTFVAKARAAAQQGYLQLASEFVAGVTDYCAPIDAGQGATAVLVVPCIAIHSQTPSSEQLRDKLLQAAGLIARAVRGEGGQG